MFLMLELKPVNFFFGHVSDFRIFIFEELVIFSKLSLSLLQTIQKPQQ